MPRTTRDDPDAEQKIRDGVCYYRIAKSVFAKHQPLKRRTTQDASKPFVVGKAEDERGDKKWERQKFIQRHG